MFIERLEFGEDMNYSSSEASIHIGRYSLVKDLCKGKKVLDIACGEGYGSYVMAKHWAAQEVHGVDIAEDAIEKAKVNFPAPNVHYYCKEAESIQHIFEEKKFDLIVSFETIEHLQQPSIYLEQISRLVKDDGIIIISCPNDHWYYKSPEQSNPFHIRKYSYEDFVNLTEKVLGKAKQYMVGLPNNGFSNISLDSSLLIDTAKNMNSIVDFENQDSIVLPSYEKISPSVSSYFIGIWTSNDIQLKNTSSVSISSMNDSRVADYNVVLNLKENINKLEEEKNELLRYNAQLVNEVAEVMNTNKKISLSIKGTNKENEFLKHNIWLIQNQLNSLMNSKSWRITAPFRKLLSLFK